ncbi:MAG: putative photosynthetic complex assembly protein PuhE [Pseudotabrizicola sp.]|nr:putative photosynthetic complex assembly protein PuhE [Pseudotabrizicola sp.]MDP2081493.1 putative photosynthetic complex assembly protein PuhE [Pseudotabrizicola sp.]MDZ7573006.1 putative photosynthetic complex assembly protein PuhE [Pseudotabrizicola sp.]
MTNPWIAALSAIFLWWFSTGIILWRVRRADNEGHDAHLWSVLLGLPLLLAGIVGLMETLNDTSAVGAYLAFLSALAVWGWVELAFLSGVITGPNTSVCPAGATLPDRFLRAIGTILWHEVLLIALLAALVILSQDAANIFGLWTFAILFFARISAKLNLFFGVPRIHTEFLPRPLAHLASHFRRAPMNWVFPLSVTALSYASYCWLERAYSATTDGALIGFTLLSALTLLALLEHWFMVIPLPDQKLWRWMLPERKPQSHGQPQPALHTTLKETPHGL